MMTTGANSVLETSDELLAEARTDIKNNKCIRMPLAKLGVLGAGIASLSPEMRTVVQETKITSNGLYRLANESVGDTLKRAKDGNFWGSFKTATGKSKMLKVTPAEGLTTSTTTIMPIDPMTLMVAAAMYSIDVKLDQIIKTQKSILEFLEREKEAEVEADVETLMTIINKSKFNWENEKFITNNHKLVLDIQRTARKNANVYYKKIQDKVDNSQYTYTQYKLKNDMNALLKEFRYYRLATYTLALSSLLEIMLSGDFKKDNISCIKNELAQASLKYRDIYTKASTCLESMSKNSIETNVLKGLGEATSFFGKMIESIPIINQGPVDEMLVEQGASMKKSAHNWEGEIIEDFSKISNPQVKVFMDQMDTISHLYNDTKGICFDNENVYFLQA